MQFPSEQVLSEFERCQIEWAEITAKEHIQYVQRWTGIYGDLYKRNYRKKSGARAMAEAEEACSGVYLVVPCRDPSASVWKAVGTAYRCDRHRIPDLTEASHYVDIFISPEDLSWTLLFGHEVDVFGGPDFVRLEWMSQPTIERVAKRRFQE